MIGSWAMMFATLIGSSQVSRSAKQPIVVNTARPVYSYVDSGVNLWNRNDNENETVHLPSDFDIGIQEAAVTGRK